MFNQISYRRFLKNAALGFLILSCLSIVIPLQVLKLSNLDLEANLDKLHLKQETENKQVRLNILKKAPSLGFNNLFADWTFLKFLGYFGDGEARQKSGYSLSPDYFEIVVERDPRFIKSYFFLSPATSLYAARPDKSVALIEKGLKSISPQLPESSLLWLYKGVDELLFLGDAKAAQHSYEVAAKWATLQDEPEIAARAREVAHFLEQNPDSKEAQIRSWMMILGNIPDERTQQLAISRIEALGGKVIITPEGNIKLELPE